MKTKIYKYMTIALVFVLGAFAATAVIAYAAPDSSVASHWGTPPAGTQGYGPGMMNGNYNGTCDGTGNCDAIADLPKEDLSSTEKDLLVFMFEEEKLARDVYTALGDTWNGGVFDMISQAEQHHMDSVKVLLDKYGISVEELPAGEFANSDLQKLYNDLIAQGATSIEDAYKVGALVEETDIRDLIDSLKTVDNQDITLVFENLNRASGHHLSAFARNIQIATGADYVPSILTQAEYDELVTNNGMMGGRGGRGGFQMNGNFGGRGNFNGPMGRTR